MFVSLLPTLQHDDIRRWGLWELIRIRGGHEGRALMNGIRALISGSKELTALCSTPCEDTTTSWQSAAQKRTVPRTTTLAA